MNASLARQLFGHAPRKSSLRLFAEKELACASLICEAIESYCSGDLGAFDARVGDKNCQALTHKVIELYLDKMFNAECRELHDNTRSIQRILSGYTCERPRPYLEVVARAIRDNALIRLSEDQAFLTICWAIKRVTRDGDGLLAERLKFIAKRAFNRARSFLNKETDDHILAVAAAVHKHWVSIGAVELVSESAALLQALGTVERYSLFSFRPPYPAFRALLHRAWQQKLWIFLTAYVVRGDHMDLLTRLYKPSVQKLLAYDPVNECEALQTVDLPLIVVVGLSDTERRCCNMPVDAFYQTVSDSVARRGECCSDVIENLTRRIDAIGIGELLSAGEAIEPQSIAGQATWPWLRSKKSGPMRPLAILYMNHFALAVGQGLNKNDASCFRPIHVLPGTIRKPLEARRWNVLDATDSGRRQ